MTIIIKNKETLIIDDFKFNCSIGKCGFTKKKIEGDKKTPRGTFNLNNIYYRSDRNSKPDTKIRCTPIKKIWVGVMILKIKKNIINLLKLQKISNVKNFLEKIENMIS